MRPWKFSLLMLVAGAGVFALALAVRSDYLFFAGYVVLQFIVLATAWNILGGYCGYVNFGTAAFFAIGTYTTVALHQLGSLLVWHTRRAAGAAFPALGTDACHSQWRRGGRDRSRYGLPHTAAAR